MPGSRLPSRARGLDDEQVIQTFQVNILAMFSLTRAALRHFPGRGQRHQHHLGPGLRSIAHAP